MFGNSLYGWKLLGACGLLALLGAQARRRGLDVDPHLWECLAEPGRRDGAALLLRQARVLSVREAEFRIEVEGQEVLVRGSAPVQPGDLGSLEATFESRGPALRLVRWQTDPRPGAAGKLLFALQVATLAGVLLNFARHFSFRPSVLQAEAMK